MRILFLFSLVALLYSPAVHAQSPSIQITPEQLSVHKSFDAQADLTLSVQNTGNKAYIYEVSAADLTRLIRVWPVQFLLAAGETQEVAVSVGHVPAGDRTTSLAVVSREIGSPVGSMADSVSIPLSLSVDPSGAAYARWFLPLGVALLLVALSGLVAATVRRKRQSAALRLIDAADETASSFSWRAWITHAWRMHRLIIVSIVCVVIASGLLVASLVIDPTGFEQASSLQEQSFEVRIRTSGEERSYEVMTEAGEQLTAFSALQKLAERYTIPLVYDPPADMGVFVRSIDGVDNGTDGRYWVYEINGRQVPVAADKSFLTPGDVLLWKFTVPDG